MKPIFYLASVMIILSYTSCDKSDEESNENDVTITVTADDEWEVKEYSY